MKKPRRNPRPSKPRQSNPAKDLLRSTLCQQLETDIHRRRGPVSSQVPVSQSTENIQNIHTPSIITNFASFPLGYSQTPRTETRQPPIAEGQVISPSYSNSPIPTTSLQSSLFGSSHTNDPTPGDLANMGPSNTHGYGYGPPHPAQSTSDVHFRTSDTSVYTYPTSTEAEAVQDQSHVDAFSLYTEDAQHTLYQDTLWQHPQPPIDLVTPSFRIRGLNRRWISIEVLLNLDIGPSYLMESAAVESGWNTFTPFPPGIYCQSETRDGLITPTHWVTVDMEDDIFCSRQRDLSIAIYPLPQPFWTSARLLVGRSLWEMIQQTALPRA